MKQRLCAVLLAAAFAGRSPAQVDDIRRLPGYVNLDWIAVPDSAVNTVDVTIGPRLMRMVHETGARRGENNAAEAGRIVSLQVKSFNVNPEAAEKMKPLLLKFERKLRDENWRPVIRLKKPDRFTNVSVKYGAERKTDGFFMMTVNAGSEASFVNIIGDVDPDRLKGMLTDVNEDVLDSLRKSMERNQRALEEHRRTVEPDRLDREKAKKTSPRE
jgi:hypothetical protein